MPFMVSGPTEQTGASPLFWETQTSSRSSYSYTPPAPAPEASSQDSFWFDIVSCAQCCQAPKHKTYQRSDDNLRRGFFSRSTLRDEQAQRIRVARSSELEESKRQRHMAFMNAKLQFVSLRDDSTCPITVASGLNEGTPRGGGTHSLARSSLSPEMTQTRETSEDRGATLQQEDSRLLESFSSQRTEEELSPRPDGTPVHESIQVPKVVLKDVEATVTPETPKALAAQMPLHHIEPKETTPSQEPKVPAVELKPAGSSDRSKGLSRLGSDHWLQLPSESEKGDFGVVNYTPKATPKRLLTKHPSLRMVARSSIVNTELKDFSQGHSFTKREKLPLPPPGLDSPEYSPDRTPRTSISS